MINESTEKVLLVLLGWILGIAGTAITALLKRPLRRRELKKSLFIEMKELRRKLAVVTVQLAINTETIDRKLLEELRPILSSYDNPHANFIENLLKLSDDQIEIQLALSPVWKEGIMLKKYSLPFLNSQIPSLSLFSNEFQRLALDINGKLGLFHEDVDTSWFYFTKTFDKGLSEDNHQLALLNLKITYRFMLDNCRNIIKDINKLLTLRK